MKQKGHGIYFGPCNCNHFLKSRKFPQAAKICSLHQQNSTDWGCWHLMYVNCQESPVTHPNQLFWRQCITPHLKSATSLDQLLLAISGMNWWNSYRIFSETPQVSSTGRDHTFCNTVFQTQSRLQENKLQEKWSMLRSSFSQWLLLVCWPNHWISLPTLPYANKGKWYLVIIITSRDAKYCVNDYCLFSKYIPFSFIPFTTLD